MPADANDLEARKASAALIRAKHPDRIPVIVRKREGDAALPDIDKRKFLVPSDLTISQFMYVIRKRIKLAPEQAIFLRKDYAITGESRAEMVHHKAKLYELGGTMPNLVHKWNPDK